ncbi:MAG: right-handed parallel beta-helix repeat-containing protein [Kiritimatiellae bacterium]|nr:right-handed parallel beta-helix repeat-containing protein [Kiritimatiellia bacterium]
MKALWLVAAALGVSMFAAGAPEVTWSVMHPTKLDPAYMARVAAKAVEYGGVDSFEVCGKCHSGENGMDGLLLFEPYPNAAAACDRSRVMQTRAALKGVAAAAHKAGKKLYYWHREGFLPKGLISDVPGLKDSDGEIDLLGESFASYLKWKVSAAFDAVPEVDGFVLTLTEADFSVIHNSRADRYPPPKVVESIVRIFCEEHEKRGKRFVLRSFGSVAKDYEDILAGAAAAAKDHKFEIETKVTPYDFSPFLPDNPFLRKVPGTTLGVECDGIGEFFGAGYLPCAQVSQIPRYVTAGRRARADRYVIRIDRVGNSIFDSAQEVNLYSYMRLIRSGSPVSRAKILSEWAAKRWPGCEKEMSKLANTSFDMAKALEFVDGNVTFHQHPAAPNFKFIKAGGVFSVFRDDADLHMATRLWGLLADRKTPGRGWILAEKEKAVKLAEEGLAAVEGLKGRLDGAEYERQHRAWSTAVKAARATRAFARCAAAYFEDMDMCNDEPAELADAVKAADVEISAMMANPAAGTEGFNVKHSEAVGANLDRVYFIPLRWLCREFLNEYRAERKVRRALEGRGDVADFVVAGGIYDDNRCDRQMHGAYTELKDGVPVRWVGNAIFPNGTLAVEFDAKKGDTVEIALAPQGAQEVSLSAGGGEWRRLAAEGGVARTQLGTEGKVRVEIGKSGAAFPGVVSVALLRKGGARPEVVKVSDFGFDAEDSTRFLQAALNSGARKVVVDKRESPWVTRPLFCKSSSQEVFFEEGVEVVAKRGEFKGRNDCLLTVDGLHDVRLAGGGKGATLRMWREDYLKPPYEKAEWRHCLSVNGSARVTVERLFLRDSGGDGVYVGRRRPSKGYVCLRRVPRDIVVRDVVADGNARQGSSITSVENLLYENCTFSNTKGRPPQAGIDVEPNGKDDPIVNLAFRNCKFLDNKTEGLTFAIFYHDETSKPLTAVVEDCFFSGNRAAFTYAQNKRLTGKRGWNRTHGRISVKRCVFEKSRERAVVVRKPGAYLRLEIDDCVIRDCGTEKPSLSDVHFDQLYGDIPPVDAVSLKNLKVFQPVDREWVTFGDIGYGAAKTEDFTGDVTVSSPSGTKKIVLDAAFRKWAFPAFWAKGEPRRRLPAAQGDKVVDEAPGRRVPLAKLRVRGDVRYVFHAPKAGAVSFKGRLMTVGKKPLPEGTAFEVRPLSGGKAFKVAIPEGSAFVEFTVDVPAAGFYSMRVDLGGHSFCLSESDVPVGIDVSECPVSIIGSTGEVYLSVRGGEPFNVMVSGSGEGERVGAELFDPSGASVWRVPSALWWHGWRARGTVAGGLWKLRLLRPSPGGMEDYHVDATGVDGTLFLSPEKHWSRAR